MDRFGSQGNGLVPHPQANNQLRFAQPAPVHLQMPKPISLNHEVDKPVDVKEYIADLEGKYLNLKRLLGLATTETAPPASLYPGESLRAYDSYSYVDLNSARVDDCKMPFFKERVEEYCEKYTLQEARLTGSSKS